jgi:cytochrome b
MRRITVWDLPTRVFHWTLVASAATAYLVSSGRPAGTTFLVHVTCGYIVVLLLLFRLAWGFIGGAHARFADFVRGPGRAFGYLKALLHGNAPRYLGHNPAGAAVIVLLLLLLTLLVATGLLAEGVSGGTGPLSWVLPIATARSVGAIHKLLGNTILVLAGIHLAGVVVESFLHRENLVTAMLTGRKPATHDADRDARAAPASRVLVLLGLLAILAIAMAGATTIPSQPIPAAAQSGDNTSPFSPRAISSTQLRPWPCCARSPRSAAIPSPVVSSASSATS